MTWESALTPTLEQTLNLILSALANFFGTTTETIMQYAPEWLAKYGWYITLNDKLGEQMGFALFMAILITGLFLMCWSFCGGHEITKSVMAISSIIFLLVFAIVTAIPIITCLIAPEMVGLEAAIKLIS